MTRRSHRVRAALAAAALTLTAVGVADVGAAPTQSDINYVDATYRGVLGRNPTAQERADALTEIERDGRVAFALDLTVSEQWLGTFVDDLYGQAFDRAPDEDGREYWVDQLRNGSSTVDVAAFVFASDEFRNRSGGTDAGVAESLYERTLGRAPDAEGLTYWIGELERTNIDAIARAFYQSEENRLRRVANLYDALLCRASDTAGAAYWAEQLNGESDHVLSRFILASSEFDNNANSNLCVGVAPPVVVPFALDDVAINPVFFDSGRGQILFDNAGVDGPVLALDSTSGQEIERWGSSNTATRVGGVSSDGRFVALITTDPALDGVSAPDAHPVSDAQLVLVDRVNDSTEWIDVGFNPHGAVISDDGQILWLTGKADLDPGDGIDTELNSNVFRLDRSNDGLIQLTRGVYSQHWNARDVSTDGNIVLLDGFGEPLVDNEENAGGLWTYDHDEGEATKVPFDFVMFGEGGELDGPGEQLLGLEGAGQGQRVFIHDVGSNDVEVIGEGFDSAAGDFSGDGSALAWTESSLLDDQFRTTGTVVGIREPGIEDWTVTIDGSVWAISMAGDGSAAIVVYHETGTADVAGAIVPLD